jgi:hypothetical protein
VGLLLWLVTGTVVQIIDENFGIYQIESISIDTNHSLSLGLHENENTDSIREGENITRPRQLETGKDTPWNALEHARLWIITHPNTVALFLVFIATVFLARSGVDSVQALLGFGCLFAGLKIMAATEDGLELPPRYTPSVRPMEIKAEQS